MLLEEMTMLRFEAGLQETRTVIVPFGSLEEHGRHLPLGTDTIHVYELAAHASKRRSLFVAPPVWYGLCRSTRQHPGTVTISMDTVRRVAMEVTSSLYEQGLRNFVLLSGHAGGTHMAALADAGEALLERLPQSRIAVLSVLDLVEDFAGGLVQTPGDSHAGELETALMLHLRFAQVDGTSPEEYPVFPKPILVRQKRLFWTGGVWGNPAMASASKGERLLNEEVEALLRLVERLEAFDET